MIWLNAIAGVAVAAIALPILIHLLVHRRAERLRFPTLRFIAPARLAAMRRRLIDDVPLLSLRIAILAAAAAALAGPIALTPARRAAWNARVARAIVVDTSGARFESSGAAGERLRTAQRESADVFRSTVIQAADPGDGLRQALSWLESAPPARREIVCVSQFASGSILASDIAALPADVGVKLVRIGELPAERVVPAGLVWEGSTARSLTVALRGADTAVTERPAPRSSAIPLSVFTAPGARQSVDAAIVAVLAERVPAPAEHRASTLVLHDAPEFEAIAAAVAPIRLPWIADAVAAIARNDEVKRRAATGDAGGRVMRTPWEPIAMSADGRPIVAAAQYTQRLMIASAAPATDLLTPLLVRAMFNVMAAPPDTRGAEVVKIPDARLRSWERPSSVPRPPHGEHDVRSTPQLRGLNDDDRRWVWGSVLVLIAIESWTRRGRGRIRPLERTERAIRVA